MNLVKSQIPLIMVYESISRSIFDFVSRQSEFAFFGAVNFGCRIFFVLFSFLLMKGVFCPLAFVII